MPFSESRDIILSISKHLTPADIARFMTTRKNHRDIFKFGPGQFYLYNLLFADPKKQPQFDAFKLKYPREDRLIISNKICRLVTVSRHQLKLHHNLSQMLQHRQGFALLTDDFELFLNRISDEKLKHAFQATLESVVAFHNIPSQNRMAHHHDVYYAHALRAIFNIMQFEHYFSEDSVTLKIAACQYLRDNVDATRMLYLDPQNSKKLKKGEAIFYQFVFDEIKKNKRYLWLSTIGAILLVLFSLASLASLALIIILPEVSLTVVLLVVCSFIVQPFVILGIGLLMILAATAFNSLSNIEITFYDHPLDTVQSYAITPLEDWQTQQFKLLQDVAVLQAEQAQENAAAKSIGFFSEGASNSVKNKLHAATTAP